MANEKNLRPLNTRSQRERKEISKMGAKASNQVQANKKGSVSKIIKCDIVERKWWYRYVQV